MQLYARYLKRPLDVLFSALGLLCLMPLMLLLSLAIFIETRENPIFSQRRPGKDERIFRLFKLKTMNSRKDAAGNLLPDEARLTQTGAFIRKTSLDEIPQLYNVLKGDMSFIGPRPLLIRYLPYYTKAERLRHSVRPGITGLAQVSGRNNLSWDERLGRDVEYVRQLSFALDISIFVQTLKKVIRGADVVVLPSNALIDLDEYRS